MADQTTTPGEGRGNGPRVIYRWPELAALEDRPWADWTAGRPITQARVARLLRPFGIHPMKLRFGERTANGYTRRMFADSWSRYLPRNVEQRNTPKNDGDEPDR